MARRGGMVSPSGAAAPGRGGSVSWQGICRSRLAGRSFRRPRERPGWRRGRLWLLAFRVNTVNFERLALAPG